MYIYMYNGEGKFWWENYKVSGNILLSSHNYFSFGLEKCLDLLPAVIALACVGGGYSHHKIAENFNYLKI